MYHNTKKKIVFLMTLIFAMIFYVGWVFYISEPKYIDYAQVYDVENPAAGETAKYPLHTYDFVAIPENREYATNDKNNVITGMVLQVDSKHALLRKYEGGYSWDDNFDLILDKSHYRVVGRGTIYHKVNHYIGFNIMVITQWIISILIVVLGFTTFSTLITVLRERGL